MQADWSERQPERAVVRPGYNAEGVADDVVDFYVLCMKLAMGPEDS